MRIKFGIIVAASLFVVGLVTGIIAPPVITRLMADDLAALQRLAQAIAPFQLNTVIFIFINNALALVLGFVLSPILCLVPALSLLVNGWALGYISSLAITQKSLGYVLLALIPHGIFEIPAFILGQAAAISMGTLIIMAVFNRDKRPLFLHGLRKNGIYLLIAIGLLIPAAVLETYLIPLLLGL